LISKQGLAVLVGRPQRNDGVNMCIEGHMPSMSMQTLRNLIYYQEMAGYMKKDCPLFEEKGEVHCSEPAQCAVCRYAFS